MKKVKREIITMTDNGIVTVSGHERMSVTEIAAVRSKDSVVYYATLKDRKKYDQIYQASQRRV